MTAESYPRRCRLDGCEASRDSPEASWRDESGLPIPRSTRRVDAAFCTAQHRRRHNDAIRRRDEELGKRIHEAAPTVADQVLIERALGSGIDSRRRQRTNTTPEAFRRAAGWLRQHWTGPRSFAAGSLRPRRSTHV